MKTDQTTSRIKPEVRAPCSRGQRPLNAPWRMDATPGCKATGFSDHQEDPVADMIINKQAEFIKSRAEWIDAMVYQEQVQLWHSLVETPSNMPKKL